MHSYVSEDDSIKFFDFKEYYKIIPTIKFNDLNINYLKFLW